MAKNAKTTCKPGCKCGVCGTPKTVREERKGRRVLRFTNVIRLGKQMVCGGCLMEGRA